MELLKIETVTEEPDLQNLMLYPDYVIGRMLHEEPCMVEADLSHEKDGVVSFVLRRRKPHSEEILGRIKASYLRMVMASFAVLSRLPNIYLGHVFFTCAVDREGECAAMNLVYSIATNLRWQSGCGSICIRGYLATKTIIRSTAIVRCPSPARMVQ